MHAAAEEHWVDMLEDVIKIEEMNQVGWWFNDKTTSFISVYTFCVQSFCKYNQSCFFYT